MKIQYLKRLAATSKGLLAAAREFKPLLVIY